ncbi:MAG TPA: hypothetical protein VEP50_09050 [bacterium]|nr:hypothetical protein [bacterium]
MQVFGMTPEERSRNGDADVVSWRMITSGMPVIASDGTRVGYVTHVLGDPGEDIFDGVGFRHHLWTSPRMAPASMVARITERAVYLSVPAAEAEQCAPYQEEHVFRIGNTGFFRHREGWREDK